MVCLVPSLPPRGAPRGAPVGGRDDLHGGLVGEAIELIQQLQHGPLNLPDAWKTLARSDRASDLKA